jgi:hypothetical protein
LGEELSKREAAPPPAPAADEPASEQLRKGEQLVQEGQYEAAIALFEQIGQRDPLNRAREVYAQSLAAQGPYQDAYDQMQLALQRRG